MSGMNNQKIIFKTVVIGASCTGKTALIRKFMENQFSQEYHTTIGVEFNSKSVQINQKVAVKLHIWDTAGQELFKAVVRSLYKGIAAVFVVYAIDQEESFQALKDWVKQAKENIHEEAVLFLVGSKADLQQKRRVSKQQVQSYLQEIQGQYFVEVSAKTGQNVEELFQKATRMMYKKYLDSGAFRNLVKPVLAWITIGKEESRQEPNIVSLKNRDPTANKNKCC